MPVKLVIDADPGIGDALAVAVALFDPEIDLVGVTATPGRVSGEDATRNLQGIVEFLDPPKWPRFGANDDPAPAVAAELADGISTDALEGPGGLGEFAPNVARLHNARESARLLIDIVRDQPNEVVLLTLGPLTTVQFAIELLPDFLSRLNALVCLGGTLTGGDVTAAAELNVYADPEAARSVLRSPATKTLVPVDVARSAVLTFDHYDRLTSGDGGGRLSRLLRELLPYAFRVNHEHFGVEGILLHELAALTTIVRSNCAEREPMTVDVETAGELTRGMTVFDRRGVNLWQTNIETVTGIEGQAVLDHLSRVVRAS